MTSPILTVKQPSTRLKWILFGLALSAAAATAPADITQVARAVDEHYNRLRSLEADFTESYQGAGMDRTESGTLWLKKPGKMRWEYRSPREKLFVTDGKDAWFYLPGERQARKTPVRKLEDLRSPLGLLLGKTRLEKELQALSFAPDVPPRLPGDVVLRGVPRKLGDRISQVLLEITPQHQIVRLDIEEADGSRTEYRFSQQRENVEVAEGRFHFSPPAGVETIEDPGP
ncbi:MAG TPA: outer membrane lipoprotein chaperone LolA [Terriglobales bacterium]|nr:outer membrane lipoprotein chaperone LolA [Terriglobales bacterium]